MAFSDVGKAISKCLQCVEASVVVWQSSDKAYSITKEKPLEYAIAYSSCSKVSFSTSTSNGQSLLATGSIGPVLCNDFRELWSNLADSTDGKIQAQDLFVYRPPLHPSHFGCAFDTCAIVNYPDVMNPRGEPHPYRSSIRGIERVGSVEEV
ncbi:hypothetical protein GCK32_014548 [Trichostrongylus colubriformis]|uniref:Uncharacterized protein n=1 Tax=Trichostrongylus colubriformis TaxID=6319 RepID=A0AAN8J3D6_TRICO